MSAADVRRTVRLGVACDLRSLLIDATMTGYAAAGDAGAEDAAWRRHVTDGVRRLVADLEYQGTDVDTPIIG